MTDVEPNVQQALNELDNARGQGNTDAETSAIKRLQAAGVPSEVYVVAARQRREAAARAPEDSEEQPPAAAEPVGRRTPASKRTTT